LSSNKRIALFGGLFDPPHHGHLRVVKAALTHLHLDKLIVLPAYMPSHKDVPALNAEARLALTRAAFKDLDKVEVSDIEIQRGGLSYTHETLSAFHADNPDTDLFFLIGADNIPEISTWRHPEKIFALATLAVVARPPFPFLDHFPELASRMVPVPVEPLELSSTDLRRRLSNNTDLSGFLPLPVLELILENGWYR